MNPPFSSEFLIEESRNLLGLCDAAGIAIINMDASLSEAGGLVSIKGEGNRKLEGWFHNTVPALLHSTLDTIEYHYA